MRRNLLLVPVFLVWLTASSHTPAQQAKDAAAVRPDDPARSKEIYRRDCLVCHGANGDGKTEILKDRALNLPNWTDPNSLGGRADQQLFNVIRFGRGKMPAESLGRANDGEVKGLVHYIRTIARFEANAEPAAAPGPSKN